MFFTVSLCVAFKLLCKFIGETEFYRWMDECIDYEADSCYNERD